jgi:L-fucose isomerase-like protein
MGKPVLIWAPQDEIFEADGTRYTDAQCGFFAISKYLQHRSIPFSYIKNCNINDPEFNKGLKKFISVACMVKNFKGLRIAQVGTRPKPFTSVMINEEDLMDKFGIQVIPINMANIIKRHETIMRDMDSRLEEEAEAFEQKYKDGPPERNQTKKIMALKYVYKQLMDEFKCDIIATECWNAFPQVMDITPCCSMSELADENIIVTCETDIKGSATMALLAAASLGKSIPYFAEFTTKHPDNKSAEMLWHCGPVAYSLKKEGAKATCANFRCNFEIRGGEYTIARMDSQKDDYFLFADTFKSTDGPYTFGNYIWAEFQNFDKVEEKLIEGPYIHHMAEIEGDYVDALKEFCKFIPYLSIDLVD